MNRYWFKGGGRKAWMAVWFLLLAPVVSAQSPITVLASVKPLQLIAEAVTQGITETQVLLPPGVTPHDYALKPSDLRRVYAADVVLWLGPAIEPYLAKPVKMHPGEQLATWQAAVDKGAKHREDELAGQSHDHDGHQHLYGDPHIWFSPEQAQHIAQQLTDLLVGKDQLNAQRYQQNLSAFLQRLAQTDSEIKRQLVAPLPNYLVAHDAYSYFEGHYGLQHVIAISETPETKPGAKGLLNLRKRIVEEQIQCLFVEPQTDPRIVAILTEDNAMQVYSLDPMATDIELSATGYENFLQNTANRFAQCHW